MLYQQKTVLKRGNEHGSLELRRHNVAFDGNILGFIQ